MKPKVFIAIIMAIFFWGFSVIWTNQLLLEDIPVFTLIFFRMAFAALILLLFSTLTKQLQRIKKGDWKFFFLMAFFEPFIYFIGETYGILATNSPTLTALIVALIPMFALIPGVVLYKEKVSWYNIVGVFLTIPGTLLMVFNTSDLTPKYWWGLLILSLAIIGSVGYSTVVKRLSSYNSVTIATYQFFIGTLLFLPPFLLLNDGYHIKNIFSMNILQPLIFLSLFCSCISFALYIFSIKEIGMTRACIFTSLIPGVSAVGSYLYGYETFTWPQIVGIVIVILGVISTQKK